MRTSLIVESLTLRQAQARILATPEVESCGFLIGRFVNEGARVEQFVFATNLSDEADRFTISPLEHQEVVRGLPASAAMLGIFHSHLGAPRPSRPDLQMMKLHAFVWLIIGNTQSHEEAELTYAAFCSRYDEPREIPLQIL